ncbi:TetR/AcrR family transcriptional regulator [Alkalimonas sp. MEB108]|uniref:TetR/AcrR family transcriptional regulator n=1 Tax=Alkalimonas cellulosilytica TaxID=3058395 RepID=A0ABU7J0Y8_9GAMM|nr:TetR/AcrR family transcriptional regulator [Alkalimonas sp. MEB108]MEE2000164.1 TetR/AcrR family transcriptional regulator [Alkalimonas sp. MEB108]
MNKRQTILQQAMFLAEHSDWESIRLRDVATGMNIPLLEIHQHFSQKDDLVDAWFDLADQAMLACQQQPDFEHNSAQDKLLTAMMQWLNAMASHRKVTRQMLYYKLEPGHIHLQAAALLRISRTVQWLREIADLKAQNVKRIEQELALTALFTSGFVRWLTAPEPAVTAARNWLERGLRLGRWRNLWH